MYSYAKDSYINQGFVEFTLIYQYLLYEVKNTQALPIL